jgi:hypothetical protein
MMTDQMDKTNFRGMKCQIVFLKHFSFISSELVLILNSFAKEQRI